MAPLVFLVAGEPSGDVLGAALMAALRERTGGDVRFAGIGGPAMAERGLESLFPMSDLSIMGIVEVLPSLRRVLRRIRETADSVLACRPDVVVTIDSQSFSYRVAKRLAPAPCPIVQYVAPTVWAWKPWRARHLAAVVDRVLLLFPFERPYWDAVGLDAVDVGHPAASACVDEASRAAMRMRLLQGRAGPLLTVLPGSRRGVIARHLPVFRAAVERLTGEFPGLVAAIPTVPGMAAAMADAVAQWPVPVTLVEGGVPERLSAMAAADAALAASGTVALELAAVATPHVIAYRANAITAAIVRRMIRITMVSPVNLVAGRQVTPELLQEQCAPENLSGELARLLRGGPDADEQRAAMNEVMAALGRGGPPPSERAADAVLAMIAGKRS